ncbi:MAG TPA: GreA/GreB family elongation factor [Steroidobacteraceae bacterium]|nr:GreA/GreB family elongation factor [Steroidobacteraceae bacterium]
MSRAFTRESDDDPGTLPERPVSSHPNLVTPSGRAALESQLRSLESELVAARAGGDSAQRARIERDLRYFAQRLASARVIEPMAAPDRVRFGVQVTLRNAGGVEQSFRLVGEDEADAARGLLSWVSPLGQALLGHEPGDTVRFQAGELEILRLAP